MAQYKDIDAILNNLPDDLPYKASVKRVLIQAPSADVVPKSEVETLAKEVDRLSQVVLYNDSVTEMKVEEAKQEVAREIFEEIERTLPNEFPFLGTAVAVYLAELKKKYTESEGN